MSDWLGGEDAAGGIAECFDGEHAGLTLLATLADRRHAWTPEVHLAWWVFKQGLLDLGNRKERVRCGARRWVRSTSMVGVYSFENLAGLFGFDAEAWRHELLAHERQSQRRTGREAA